MNISLCIPTMDRWDFLKVSIPKYLDNPYINEIVICDENGNDVKNINNTFTSDKIRTHINDEVLGAFFNKQKVVSLAKNDIICLMDSDNFAPLSYFESFKGYINTRGLKENTIYMPSRTIPQPNHRGFDYRNFINLDINMKNINHVVNQNRALVNTGNYIFSKTHFEKAKLTDENVHLGKTCLALDVLLQNYLFFKRCPDTQMVVVPGMEYDHIVHPGSYYITTYQQINTNMFHALFNEF